MGSDTDSLNASVAHLVLCCVAGRGIQRMSDKSFTHPGMHANFFIHGVLGFFHYQSGLLSNDFKPAYTVSLKASKYLALPCLMADLRRDDSTMASLHLLSGVIPFVVSLVGEDNVPLGNLMIALNLISLCHYSHTTNREWGWYTAAAGLVAYFITPQTDKKMVYPLCLGLMQYCAYRVFHSHYDPPPDPRAQRR